MHAQPTAVLDEATARKFFCHLLSALRHAHARNFIHCDLKPENVRLSKACDRAVIVDWGLARQIDRQPQQTITQGSPAYGSPEQHAVHCPHRDP